MKKAFAQQLDTWFLPAQPVRVLLGISGGLDSVAMGCLFHAYAQTHTHVSCGVAHAHFGLRQEADEEAAFVQARAQAWGFAFYEERLAPIPYARTHKQSLQEAARHLRYGWWRALCAKEGFDYVATAHQKDDSLETWLLNLLRGTGWAGLCGIAAKEKGLLRPMLLFTRQDIEKEAQRCGWEWREDASNKRDDYLRNRIRARIAAPLKALAPTWDKTFTSSCARMQAFGAVMRDACTRFREKHLSKHAGYELLTLPTELRAAHEGILWELLQSYGLLYSQFKQLYGVLGKKKAGKHFHTASHLLLADRGRIYLHERASEDTAAPSAWLHEDTTSLVQNNRHFVFERKPRAALGGFEDTASYTYVDYDCLRFPLELRPPRARDFFIPLGMKGKKKVRDFMIEKKIPVQLKKKVLVLTSEGRIVWVAGLRTDERFKVREKTTRVWVGRLCSPLF